MYLQQTMIPMLCFFYIYLQCWKVLVCASYSSSGYSITVYLCVLDNDYTGCPNIIRSDCGTENTSLAAAQMALRHGHDDAFSGEKSFRFGSSTTNTVRNFYDTECSSYGMYLSI